MASEVDTSKGDRDTPSTLSLYTRNASGMVREVSTLDMMAYNASATAGTGMMLVILIFALFAIFPGANVYVAVVVGYLVAGIIITTFALLTSAFPRAGGDYLFGSRVIHPVVGLGSNIGVFLSTILGLGLFGVFTVTIGIAPIFNIIGVTTGNSWWQNAAATVSHRGWELVVAICSIGALSLVSAYRTKVATRTLTWSFAIGTAGFLVALLVMVFTSQHSFIHALNNFARPYTHSDDTYAATVKAGAKAGAVYPSTHGGYSTSATLGAASACVIQFMLCFWGSYMAGEMKGASRRNRQLATMLIPAYVQGALVILAVVVFIHTTGYNFLVAANAGALGVPVAPYYNFFSSIASGSNILSVIMALTFLGFIYPVLYVNSSMVQRALFAWSFDGLLPRRVSSVSERTRTPVLAITIVGCLGVLIAALYIYDGSSLSLLLGLSTVFLVPAVIVAGVAGLMLPRRLPQLFANGPADWRVAGVPVLPVVSAASVIVGIVLAALYFHFHANWAVKSALGMPLALIGCFVVAGVWYALAARFQRQKGVDLRYVYGSIPPE